MASQGNRMLTAISRLVRGWWRVDKVRISPQEGRLLGLQPPCYLHIGEQTVEVIARQALVEDSACAVIYHCKGEQEQEQCELRVELTGLRQLPHVQWSVGSDVRELSVDEIEIFQ